MSTAMVEPPQDSAAGVIQHGPYVNAALKLGSAASCESRYHIDERAGSMVTFGVRKRIVDGEVRARTRSEEARQSRSPTSYLGWLVCWRRGTWRGFTVS